MSFSFLPITLGTVTWVAMAGASCDQTDVLTGTSATGHRESLLTFIGANLVAERWKQWRIYFTDVHPTGIGPQREPGMFSAIGPLFCL